MSREVITRDELLTALRVLTQIVQGFPVAEFAVLDSAPAPRLAADASLVSTSAAAPTDGSIVPYGHGKGQPQPPRKQYTARANLKLERVEWGDLPRASRRIAELLANTSTPLTSHEIIRQLGIARPTFNNAMSKLRQHKIVVTSTPSRGVVRHGAENR